MSETTAPTTYKLMRARDGRMLGGVAAGLARASGMDVTIVRICVGATVLTFGLGIPAYILMWVVLPEESPKRGRVIEPAPENIARGIRIALVVIAALSVINELGGLFPFSGPRTEGFGWGGLIGLILLGVGVSVLFSRHRPDGTWWEPSSPPTSASTASWRASAPAGDDADAYLADPDDDPPTYVGPFRDVVEPVSEAVSEAMREVRTTFAESRSRRPKPAAYADEYYFDDDEYDDAYRDAPRPVAMVTSSGLRESGGAALAWARVLGWILLIWFTLASIGVTVAWLFGAVEANRPLLLGVVTLLVWIAVTNTLVHAKFARAILPSLALLLIPVVIAGATVRPDGTIGHQISEPAAIENPVKNYNVSFGRLDINLADTDFTHRKTTINAHVGTGAMFIEVPNDAEVTVRAKAGLGGYEVFGRKSDGASPRETFPAVKGCEGGPRLTLNVDTGIGYITIHRANNKRDAVCKAA